MRFPMAVSAAAIVAIAVAACSGGQQANYIAPPPSGAPASGALVLAQTSQTQSAGTAGGVTGTLTYIGGTGTVTATSSATAPAGTTTVSPVARVRVQASATSPNVYYVTISSTAGATLTGLPAVALVLAAPAIGTFQEAQFSGGTWTNIPGATGTLNTAGTAVEFPAGTTALTIAAGSSIFLAFYQGNSPQATPAPLSSPTNVIADSGFESPATAPPVGSPVTATGWSVCTITAASGTAQPPASRPFSAYTPTPGTVPGAAIEALGTSVPQGTGTPTPTQTTVPAHSGGYAAVFGGVFSTYGMANWGYNGLCQQVTVPQNAAASMYLWANGTEGALAYFGFDVDVLDTTGKFLANLYDENQIGVTPPGDSAWRQVTIAPSAFAPYAGQTVQIFVGIWTKAGSGSNATTYSGLYFLDDFTLTGNP